VQSVRFVVKRWGYCYNLSAGVAMNVQFTMDGMCANNSTSVYVAQISNNRVTVACNPS